MTIVKSTISWNSANADANADAGGDGGGIYNYYTTITIVNSTISGNSANGSFISCGGGICNWEGTITIVNSAISGNFANADVNYYYARAYGGGIYNDTGIMTIVNSTISGNSAHANANADADAYANAYAHARGGGICNWEGTITIVNSAISGNFANADGDAYAYASDGGIYNYHGTMTIVNCTISGNSANANGNPNNATAYGGGIYNGHTTITIVNSTISGNSANATAANADAYGGGIYNYYTTITIVNSTISGNSVSARGANATAEGKDIYNDGTITHTLPDDFSLPDIDITVAVLTPVTERLSKEGTLTLDASSSYNASAYWWDLNSDGTYDFKTSAPYLTLCGEEYAETISGNMISWNELKSLGYDSGDAINVTLATATASGAASLNAQTSNIKIQAAALNALSASMMNSSAISDGINSLLNTSKAMENIPTEVGTVSIQDFAKQCAYDTHYKVNDTVKGTDGHTYKLEKIIKGANDSGFYSQVWVPTDSATTPAIVAIRGTIGDAKSIMADTNTAGVAYSDYLECQQQLVDYLETMNRKVHLTGHSAGGAQAQRLAADATQQGIVLDGVTTYNSPGISYENAAKFVTANGGTVNHYIIEGDVVSLAGEAFITGTNTLYKVSGANKHTAGYKNYYSSGSDYISGSNHNIATADLNSPLFHYDWSANTSLKNFLGPLSSTNFRCTAEAVRKGVGTVVESTTDTVCTVKTAINLKQNELSKITELTLKKLESGVIEVLGKLSLNGDEDCALNVNLDVSKGYLTEMTLNDTLDQYLSKDIRLTNVSDWTIQNFKMNATSALSLSGKADMEVVSSGKNALESAIISATGNVTANSKEVSITSDSSLPEKAADVLVRTGKMIYDTGKKLLKSGGELFTSIGDAIETTVKELTHDEKTKTTNLSGTGDVTVPQSVSVLGGKTLKNADVNVQHSDKDGGSTISAKKNIVTEKFSKVVNVVRDTAGKWFARGLSLLNPKPKASASIAPMNSAVLFAETPASDYLLQLSWTGSAPAGTVVLILSNGTRIAESDFANYGLELIEDFSGDTQRVFAVSTSSDVSGWSFEMTGKTVAVKTDWYEFVDQEPLAITGVTVEENASLTIAVEGEIRDDTVMRFYADTDSEGEGGQFLFEITGADLVNGNYNWQPENIEAGTYYLYVKTIEAAYYSEAVVITTSPHLTTTSSDTYSWGETTPQNPGAEYQHALYTFTNTGNAPLSLSEWSLTGMNTEAFRFAVLDADGNETPLSSVELLSGETLNIQASLISDTLTAGDKPSFTLTAATNDAALPTLSLTGSAIVVDSVGTISGADKPISISRRQGGAYTFVLDAQPTAEVTVYISASEGIQTDVQRLTFTPENWNAPQTVNVSAKTPSDKPITALIQHSIVSSDYNILLGGVSDVAIAIEPSVISDFNVIGTTVNLNGKPVESLSDWDSFQILLTTPDVSEAFPGDVAAAVITYNPQLFLVEEDAIYDVPNGISAEISAPEDAPNGLKQVEVRFTVGESGYQTTASEIVWGAIQFTPNTVQGAGVEDVFTPETLGAVDGAAIGTTVEAVPFDLQKDGVIDLDDFIQFALMFDQRLDKYEAGTEMYNKVKQADFNGNGVVELDDFVAYALNFGQRKDSGNVQIQMPVKQSLALSAPARVENTPDVLVGGESITIQPPMDLTADTNLNGLTNGIIADNPQIALIETPTAESKAIPVKNQKGYPFESVLSVCEKTETPLASRALDEALADGWEDYGFIKTESENIPLAVALEEFDWTI